jgi:hypothetical protein
MPLDSSVDFLTAIKKNRFLPVFVLLTVFASLAVSSLIQKSATFDETNHLIRGLYPLSVKEFALNKEHPPLVNLLQGLPVSIISNPILPQANSEMHPFFHYSRKALWLGTNDAKTMIFQARLVTVFLAVLLGISVFWWARELYGYQGGLFSLALYCFSPAILAHGRLVTTDLGLAFFLFVYYFSLWNLLRFPSIKKTIVAGLCLGAAMGSKHLALLLIPITLAVLLLAQSLGKIEFRSALNFMSQTILDRLDRARGIFYAILVWLIIVVIAFFIVWGLYGFSIDRFEDVGILIPMPDYFEGLKQGWNSVKSGRVYYLDGEVSDSGWSIFFLKAFVYKTPIPLLIILLGALVWRFFDKKPIGEKMGWIFLALICFVLALATKKVNLGLRYLLSVYPFLFLFAGVLVRISKFKPGLLVLIGWLAIEVFTAHPHYISYFNQLIPPGQKRFHLVDSNLDWGQDLTALANWQKDNKVKEIRLGYFGTANPEAYGVKYEPLPFFLQEKWTGPQELELKGVIAVSATLLQGVYNRPPGYYAPLRQRKPDVILGDGSMLIFDLR